MEVVLWKEFFVNVEMPTIYDASCYNTLFVCVLDVLTCCAAPSTKNNVCKSVARK